MSPTSPKSKRTAVTVLKYKRDEEKGCFKRRAEVQLAAGIRGITGGSAIFAVDAED